MRSRYSEIKYYILIYFASLTACGTTYHLKEAPQENTQKPAFKIERSSVVAISTQIVEPSDEEWRPGMKNWAKERVEERNRRFESQLISFLKGSPKIAETSNSSIKFEPDGTSTSANYAIRVLITGGEPKESIIKMIGDAILSTLTLFMYPVTTTRPYNVTVSAQNLQTKEMVEVHKNLDLIGDLHGATPGQGGRDALYIPYVHMVLPSIESLFAPAQKTFPN